MIVAAGALSTGAVIPAAADADPRGYLTKMRAEEMWKVADGTGITVAVIDSGVSDQPGLKGRVLPGISFIESPVERPDITYPPNEDFVGHGTSMAAGIVGNGSDGGPQGLAPGAKVLPIRTAVGLPMAFAVAGQTEEGIRYAVDHGAKIINLSIGVYEARDVATIAPAVQYARGKGVLIFAAMGNDGAGKNANNPIASLPGVIGVGAVDAETANPMPFTSHGVYTDLSATGSKVQLRCEENKGWCVADGGTSYATSLASASAALIWSAHPGWTANQVTRVLLETAGAPTDGSKRTDRIGYGVVRPRMALLEHKGDPGAADVDPLDAAPPAKAPSPVSSAGPTAGVPAASAEEASSFPWQWPALGAGLAVVLGLGLTVVVKRQRSR
ncbi:S8 family serine peptidase [Streptomyces sp. NPDC059917]|uniref:S8 family serine peptidase n=1 Tax=Streptomyces sp. NPDC059917 TaxID=3347002 RepID=UPI00364B32AD